MPKNRTVINITDHVQAVIDHMETILGALSYPVPIGFGERPIDPAQKHYPPPYLVVSYIAGGSLEGPLSDTQADGLVRILLLSTGNTAHEATVLRDIAHAQMQASNFIGAVTNRKIRDVRVSSVTDGIYRDDDVPTPIFYTRQNYLMDSVPA